ncbi:helix-turn-helix domain-containing protein [Streptomyces sp. YS-3]|uniref:helix-turn-helix domain-containing protein n=1 Tax=Streptomyces sp. YS-3 TaxID=3381352 RepID=UPI0038627F65
MCRRNASAPPAASRSPTALTAPRNRHAQGVPSASIDTEGNTVGTRRDGCSATSARAIRGRAAVEGIWGAGQGSGRPVSRRGQRGDRGGAEAGKVPQNQDSRDVDARGCGGAPCRERRRVPGLRREVLALLAGVSASYYTWLEQGQSLNASPRLDTITRALRLEEAERLHLHDLARLRGRSWPRADDRHPSG